MMLRTAVATLLMLISMPLSIAAQRPTLRVGTAPDYPPLTFVADGELRGVEVEFAHQLGKDLGRSLEFVSLEFEALLPALLDGRIDVIMSGMSVTPERARRVRFTTHYLEVAQMALVRRKDFGRLREPGALGQPDVRIGFEAETTGAALVRAKLGSARQVAYPDADAAITALRRAEIDAFIHDAPTVWRIVGGFDSEESELIGLYSPLTEECLAWAVRPDDVDLATALDQAVERWRESGWLELTLARWIRVRKVAVAR